MAVELSNLYKEICSEYEVALLTDSFFGKSIEWLHTMEDEAFAYLLHGNELIFNSSLNSESEAYIKSFIDKLIEAHAGGIIVAMQKRETFPQSVIAYCNQMQFPVIWASWATSYLEIIRRFSEILLIEERNATNLIAAMKNAIFYPLDDSRYLTHMERNGFFRDMSYTIAAIGCKEAESKPLDAQLVQIEKSLRYLLNKVVVYEENNRLIVLTSGYSPKELAHAFKSIHKKHPEIYIGIGSVSIGLQEIHVSYNHALTAFQLTSVVADSWILAYDDMGIFQLLTDIEHPQVVSHFLEDTLGALLEHDQQNNTEYIQVLKTYFANECSIGQTAEALYCHKNTLYYKINAIKEILGYDILSNENRAKIILAFHLLELKNAC